MKRLMAILLTVALALTGAAMAEAAVQCEIIEGGCVIRIPDENGDLGWLADEGSEQVALAGAAPEGGEFVVRYDALADGETAVTVRHYTGIACDRVYTWELTVEDGAITRASAGASVEAPDPAESDPLLIGEWQTEDGLGAMTVEKNPGGRAWDVEAVLAEAQGATVFKTTVYYDCDRRGFVYDKGKYWDTPIEASDEAAELGEAKVAGATGMFSLSGDGAALRLGWEDDLRPGEIVEFRRVDAMPAVDYGASGLYSKQELDAAAALVTSQLESWGGWTLYNLRYAGDACDSPENRAWLSELNDKDYAQCLELLTDLRTPADALGALEPDTDCPDYEWWLAREAGGDWELVTFGY